MVGVRRGDGVIKRMGERQRLTAQQYGHQDGGA